ncbi:MAG: DUF483 domain-containing protein [archaeon]|nr:DUF483 domain-containing protein [archaeon]MCP8314340.1 DUF483 domain-containing protein [archaeon]MCP8316261.1 DUF483 domain-containing protein [archaeon]
MEGYESFKRIVMIIEHIRSLAENLPLSEAIAKAKITYKDYPKVVSVIAEAASSYRLIGLEERLHYQLTVIKNYMPPVRPAIDPEFALALLLYSLDHLEVGLFLGYPKCCIRSFIDYCRMFFDERHKGELEKVRDNGLSVVLTAGFIPCSLNCINAVRAGLLSHLKDISVIRQIDTELKEKLPHSHPAYQSFYEVLS